MKNIFLSASIPLIERDPKYYDTADVVAIRDSVRALASIVLPKCRLIWGGHPAIAPLIKYVLDRSQISVNEHMTTYLSLFFKKDFLSDMPFFGTIKYIPMMSDRDKSLEKMRRAMIGSNNFAAGIFIGGMEGVEDEFEMFRAIHGNQTKVFPIASTGAAAKILFDKQSETFDRRLLTDYAYNDLFSTILDDLI